MVIAESGGTKTDWRWVNNGQVKQLQTSGIQPNYTNVEEASDILSEFISVYPEAKNESIVFYGAGCEFLDQNHWLPLLLKDNFGRGVELYGDTLAAARASLGNLEGTSIILGTGANVSSYNGEQILKSYSGFGYVLGDEGSGAYLGKMLLKDVLEERVPKEIAERLKTVYKWDNTTIIENVYRKPSPNKYMASFAEYIFKNRKNEYFQNLILKNFRDLFHTSILPHEELKGKPIGAVGSVSFYFEQYLKYVAEENGLFVKQIVQSPIASLVLFHE